MFLIYFISYGCNDSALVFLGGAEASASPSFALPMFITIKKIIILHLFLGVPAATVSGTGTPWHTRGYAPVSVRGAMPPSPVVNPRISEANTELGSERCDAAVTDAQSWTTSAHTLIQCLNAVQQNSRQVRIPDKQVEMLKDQLQFQSSKF